MKILTAPRMERCISGLRQIAEDAAAVSRRVQGERWRRRFETGYEPERVAIPHRFLEVTTWKGPIDAVYFDTI